MVEEVQLKVEPVLRKEDVGKKIARINEDLMQEIGVEEGDILEIKGSMDKLTFTDFIPEERRNCKVEDTRKTPVIVRRSEIDDNNSNIIRLDRFVRKDIQTVIGENVSVEKADVKKGKEITVYSVMPGKQNFDKLEESFLGFPVSKGDTVTFLNNFFATPPDTGREKKIFKVNFTVEDTHPDGIVLVTRKTNVEIFEPETPR